MCTRSASGTQTGGWFCPRQPACSQKQGARLSSGRIARSANPCRRYSGSTSSAAHSTTAHRTRPRASCSCRAAAAASSGARVPAARLSGPAAGVRKYPPAVQPQPKKLRSAAAAATSASMGSRMHPAPGAPRTPPVPHASPTVSIRSTSLRGRYTQLTSPLTS